MLNKVAFPPLYYPMAKVLYNYEDIARWNPGAQGISAIYDYMNTTPIPIPGDYNEVKHWCYGLIEAVNTADNKIFDIRPDLDQCEELIDMAKIQYLNISDLVNNDSNAAKQYGYILEALQEFSILQSPPHYEWAPTKEEVEKILAYLVQHPPKNDITEEDFDNIVSQAGVNSAFKQLNSMSQEAREHILKKMNNTRNRLYYLNFPPPDGISGEDEHIQSALVEYLQLDETWSPNAKEVKDIAEMIALRPLNAGDITPVEFTDLVRSTIDAGRRAALNPSDMLQHGTPIKQEKLRAILHRLNDAQRRIQFLKAGIPDEYRDAREFLIKYSRLDRTWHLNAQNVKNIAAELAKKRLKNIADWDYMNDLVGLNTIDKRITPEYMRLYGTPSHKMQMGVIGASFARSQERLQVLYGIPPEYEDIHKALKKFLLQDLDYSPTKEDVKKMVKYLDSLPLQERIVDTNVKMAALLTKLIEITGDPNKAHRIPNDMINGTLVEKARIKAIIDSAMKDQASIKSLAEVIPPEYELFRKMLVGFSLMVGCKLSDLNVKKIVLYLDTLDFATIGDVDVVLLNKIVRIPGIILRDPTEIDATGSEFEKATLKSIVESANEDYRPSRNLYAIPKRHAHFLRFFIKLVENDEVFGLTDTALPRIVQHLDGLAVDYNKHLDGLAADTTIDFDWLTKLFESVTSLTGAAHKLNNMTNEEKDKITDMLVPVNDAHKRLKVLKTGIPDRHADFRQALIEYAAKYNLTWPIDAARVIAIVEYLDSLPADTLIDANMFNILINRAVVNNAFDPTAIPPVLTLIERDKIESILRPVRYARLRMRALKESMQGMPGRHEDKREILLKFLIQDKTYAPDATAVQKIVTHLDGLPVGAPVDVALLYAALVDYPNANGPTVDANFFNDTNNQKTKAMVDADTAIQARIRALKTGIPDRHIEFLELFIPLAVRGNWNPTSEDICKIVNCLDGKQPLTSRTIDLPLLDALLALPGITQPSRLPRDMPLDTINAILIPAITIQTRIANLKTIIPDRFAHIREALIKYQLGEPGWNPTVADVTAIVNYLNVLAERGSIVVRHRLLTDLVNLTSRNNIKTPTALARSQNDEDKVKLNNIMDPAHRIQARIQHLEALPPPDGYGFPRIYEHVKEALIKLVIQDTQYAPNAEDVVRIVEYLKRQPAPITIDHRLLTTLSSDPPIIGDNGRTAAVTPVAMNQPGAAQNMINNIIIAPAHAVQIRIEHLQKAAHKFPRAIVEALIEFAIQDRDWAPSAADVEAMIGELNANPIPLAPPYININLLRILVLTKAPNPADRGTSAHLGPRTMQDFRGAGEIKINNIANRANTLHDRIKHLEAVAPPNGFPWEYEPIYKALIDFIAGDPACSPTAAGVNAIIAELYRFALPLGDPNKLDLDYAGCRLLHLGEEAFSYKPLSN